MSQAIADMARRGGVLGIDTEFVSERRYQALLCLLQVAVPDPTDPSGVRTEVLDPLDESEPFDHRPLAEVLADPQVEILMHAGRQDVGILRRTWNTSITNLFDTQVAAGFVGMGIQEGYESLVRQVLGVPLRGGEGFTRWDQRPLSDRQLEYAADDARCLLALGDALKAELEQRGRLDWAREESRLLEGVTDERSARRSYEKLPTRGMTGRQRGIAKRLVEWREEAARRADRPPSSILPDPTLVQLARRTPADKAGLEQIRGLPQQTLHRMTRELLDAIAAAKSDDEAPPPPPERRTEAVSAPIVAVAQAVLRHRAHEAGIAPELIATKSDLVQLIAAARNGRDRAEGADEVRALGGWRREVVGEELCALAAGRLSVSVGPDGGLLVHEIDL